MTGTIGESSGSTGDLPEDGEEFFEDDGSELPAKLELEGVDSGGQTKPAKFASDKAANQALGPLELSMPGTQTGFTAGLSNVPPFQLRKSEFNLPDLVRREPPARQLVEDFLKQTTLEDEESDRRELTHQQEAELRLTRESLLNATNSHDAVSDALHLARLYQHLRYIEEAKKAIDLSLGLDPDNRYGRELFKELERMHPQDLGVAARITTPQPISKSNLRKRILHMSGGKVIVVGDLLIDELLEGRPERISREAPVLILEHVDTELIPGGAANTAHNISALGGVCHAVGVCGRDEYARRLAAIFERTGIRHSLVEDASRPTTVKTRILSKSHSLRQQLLRIDRICHDPIAADVAERVVRKVEEVATGYAAIILSDYRGGIMTDVVVRGCREIASKQNLLLVVDAQDQFARFQNVTLLTPNQPDAEKAVGYEFKSREDVVRAGQEIMDQTGAKALLITRGAHGMALFQQNEPMVELPVFNRSEVFDVTGAGDTVVSTMALALVTGASFVEAMALGNLAAGIVVRKPGTAVTSQREMLETLDSLKLID